jgi:hypothetical protein
MRFFTTAVALLSLAGVSLSALTVQKYPGAAPDRYLVKLRDDANKDDIISLIERSQGEVVHNWSIFNGFAGWSPILAFFVYAAL